MNKYGIALLLCLMTTISVAQNGNIRGTVFDDSYGETLPGVTILIEGTNNGTSTDLDGKFNLSVPPGQYTLSFSFISFQTLTISQIEVKLGQTTLLDNIRMQETSFELSEVTVTADALRNTETALLTIKRKSPGVIDGISAANFRKIGDSDAAASMKRVPGVSVEGGRYVYVRGLGDRYSKTILNGMDLPGLDPDRNTIQMDIFPTNIIDNIIVHKTFTADLPADFTGGVVDISLKDFPEEKSGSFSLSAGYNPQYHFNEDFLTYKGGKYDFLGFDDGTRSIPASEDIPLFAEVVGKPDGEQGLRYREILRSFNPQMAAFNQRSSGDYSLGFTVGNQIPRNAVTYGYTINLSYKSNTEFYNNVEFGRYGLDGNPDAFEMVVREYQMGDYGVQSVLLSANTGFAIKTKSSKLRLNVMHLQNGESKAGLFRYEGSSKGSNFSAAQHNLEYTQRALSNILLEGKHIISKDKWTIDWKLTPTISRLEDPDIRFTRFEDRGQGTWSIGTEVGFPERIWRELEEINLAGSFKSNIMYSAFGQKNSVDFGVGYTFKERDYQIRNFMLNIRNIPLTGNPNEFFFEENLWPYNGSVSRGTTYDTPFIPVNPNQFNSTITNLAGFIQTEINPLQNIRAILGVRMEHYVQKYTGQDQQGYNILDNETVLDNLDLFPSVNLIYALNEKQNIRLSYAKTIARPSFKEMSYAEIYDPLTGRTFIGGLFRDADDIAGSEYWDGNLVSSKIMNYDLRWEMFHAPGQMISLSLFHKTFDNPIEMVQFAVQDLSIQPRNVGKGQVTGIEFEIRQNLDIFARSFENFTLTTNLTLTRSNIQLSPSELDSRIMNARTGQTIEEYRDMAGQAPYIINSGLSYNGGTNGFLKGLEAGLFYNVQGRTLHVVGITDRPDIYTLPFHSLNFNANKRFGENQKWTVGIKADNLLNAKKESIFSSFNASDRYYQRISQGTTLQLRMAYSL
ncbi:MAG: TonB-dependent receptor [Bacteroidales bacterium]